MKEKGKNMDEKQLTPYDELMQTRDVQILKSVLPYLERSAQKQTAFIIQYLEFVHVRKVFENSKSTLSICEVPDGTDKRSAILSAVRKYCTPKEQETIDTLLNLFSIMENYDMLSNM